MTLEDAIRLPVDLPGSKPSAPLSLLLLCDYDRMVAETARQHMDALAGQSRHRVHRLDIARRLPRPVDLDRFDGLIIHYSLVASLDGFGDEETLERFAGFRGIKALFIQDEHRHVLRTRALLRRLGITVLFTCVPAGEVEKVYPAAELPGLRKETVLTGYVAPELARRALLTSAIAPVGSRPGSAASVTRNGRSGCASRRTHLTMTSFATSPTARKTGSAAKPGSGF